MTVLDDLRYRLRALFSRSAMEAELDEELRFHLEREADKHERAGVPRGEAMRRARVALGGLERIKDDTRDQRGVMSIDTLRQDIRFAWRGLTARPGFTAGIVLTFALGIGANAAMFGIVDRLLLRPAPFMKHPDRTHRVYLIYQQPVGQRVDRNIEYTRFADLARWTSSFELMTAFASRTAAIGVGDATRELEIQAVSRQFFDFFDVRPVLGRFFLPEEDRTPTGARVVVLSYPFWQTQFGGAPDVLGQQVRIGNTVYEVVGVAPQGFVGMIENPTPVAFVPITTLAHARNRSYYLDYDWSWLEVLALRKPGVSIAAANADLSSAFVKSWNAEQELTPGIGAATTARLRGEIAPIHMARGPQAGPQARVAVWVMGVAVIVLLVACANVTNLLLARAVQRRREIAVRLALGVTRRRLLQQLLTESVLLAALGGVAGLLAAQWGGRALRAAYNLSDAAVLQDGRTLAFVALLTLAVAVLTGLAPLAHAGIRDLAGSLKSGARDGGYQRSTLRNGLLVFQAAVSVVLLVGAGLFVRSLERVTSRRLGYDVKSLVFVETNMRRTELSDSDRRALDVRLEDAAWSLPGIAGATRVVSVPFWSNEGRGAPYVPGRDSTQKLGRFLLQAGSPSYFDVTGTRIIRGRGFTEQDGANAPRVMIVTQRMANVLWPGEDPIGKVLRFDSDTTPYSTVIGVAETMQARLFQDEREYWYIIPIAQYEAYYGNADGYLMARVQGDPADHQEALRRRLQREVPGEGYVKVTPLQQRVGPEQGSWRFAATMFVAFGGLALLLAALGLYSVVGYAVAQRTHELGVRIALGASVGNVVRLIISHGLAFVLAGILIGGAVAWWAATFVEPLLYAQEPRDPLVYGGVVVVLLVVTVIATLQPALRATRVDPTVALRAD